MLHERQWRKTQSREGSQCQESKGKGIEDSPTADDSGLPQMSFQLIAREHMLNAEATQRYANAFSALRQMKFQNVKTLLTQHLKTYPSDFQAQRLLKIALLLKKKKLAQEVKEQIQDSDLYVRRYVGCETVCLPKAVANLKPVGDRDNDDLAI
eukprot:gene54311-44675_t